MERFEASHLTPLVPQTTARHLPAIPGLGDYDAACYLAGVGSLSRFQRAAEVWAFAGYDPIRDGSGDKPERIGHLSRRGDPAFRDALYQMGYRVAQNYAPVSLTFLNAYERGKCEACPERSRRVEATIHAVHQACPEHSRRVNRICFHLMHNDEPFEDQTTPQLKAERARGWQQFKADKKKRPNRRTRGKHRH